MGRVPALLLGEVAEYPRRRRRVFDAPAAFRHGLMAGLSLGVVLTVLAAVLGFLAGLAARGAF